MFPGWSPRSSRGPWMKALEHNLRKSIPYSNSVKTDNNIPLDRQYLILMMTLVPKSRSWIARIGWIDIQDQGVPNYQQKWSNVGTKHRRSIYGQVLMPDAGDVCIWEMIKGMGNDKIKFWRNFDENEKNANSSSHIKSLSQTWRPSNQTSSKMQSINPSLCFFIRLLHSLHPLQLFLDNSKLNVS